MSNGPLVNEVMRVWEIETPAIPATLPGNPPPRIAVVLTGNMIYSLHEPTPIRPVFGREGDRATQALWLYKTRRVQKIIISGGQGDLAFQTPSAVDEGQMIRQFLQMAGVPDAAIFLEAKSRNTHENALFSARLLRQQFQTNACVVVTSAWHMRRSKACFEKQNVLVTPWPSAPLAERRAVAPGAYLLPNEKAFGDAQLLFRELVGYLTYWIVGYL